MWSGIGNILQLRELALKEVALRVGKKVAENCPRSRPPRKEWATSQMKGISHTMDTHTRKICTTISVMVLCAFTEPLIFLPII